MQPHHIPRAAETLPGQFQEQLNRYVAFSLNQEKIGYSNDLIPFSQHCEQVKEQTFEKCRELQRRLHESQKLLKSCFQQEEAANPALLQEFSLSSLQEAVKRYEAQQKESDPTHLRALQSELDIPWSFMDRAFQAGKKMLQENRFEEAANIFFFLRFLQPRIFDYWVCEATCLHERGQFEEALQIYQESLQFQPKNPLVFFQMASCLFRLGEISKALDGFEKCLQAAETEPKYQDLYREALQIRTYLQERR